MNTMLEAFKTRAEAVSAQVERVTGKEQALQCIAALLLQEGVSSQPGSHAVWAGSRMLSPEDQKAIASAVPGIRFDVTRELAAEAKVGISQMDWAVANTGTLVQDAVAVEQRLVSTLPPVHIAVVATSSLLPDLPALLARVDPTKTAYLAFITGPSRTADIERVLTIGVHGPGKLIIVMVDDLEVAS